MKMTRERKHEIIKELYSDGASVKAIAEVIGYSKSNVSKIISGENVLKPNSSRLRNCRKKVDWTQYNPGLMNVERKHDESEI